ncbi:hypothetical protein OKW22_001052 [Bacilli bacterium PM5-3]|nr:hypothetical protein [Bacilli bacterium PM5-3]MDH6604140.1 hypothetical protein [Bacilli bacterium PM5-9]
MKRILISILAFSVFLNIIPNTIEAKVYDIGKGYKVELHAPNGGKPYYHVHVTRKDGSVRRCINLSNFKECDKKNRKGNIGKAAYDKMLSLKKVKSVIISYHKAKLKLIKKKVPKWAWYTIAGIATVVAITTSVFPGDDAAAGAIWKIALSV